MTKALGGSVILLWLLLESCNSDFNINAPHQDVYVLNCVLRSDTSIQYATISKNYFTENGTAPPPNTIESNIPGVSIKIYYDDSVFVMRDTTAQLTGSGYATPVNCYYAENLEPTPGKVISIEASVPGGDTLRSTIHVPQISYGYFSPTFPQVKISHPPTSIYSAVPSYSWTWIGNTRESTTILDLPELEVDYRHYEHGIYVDKKILVPLAFYFTPNQDGVLSPVNVELSFKTSCVTLLETVNKTMQDISGNDPYKGNYSITRVVFNVISLDPELSKYYSAYESYSENFTVKLRQTDFSNIEGGKGIFGLYYKFSEPLVIDSIYVESFGYRYDPL